MHRVVTVGQESNWVRWLMVGENESQLPDYCTKRSLSLERAGDGVARQQRTATTSLSGPMHLPELATSSRLLRQRRILACQLIIRAAFY